MRKVKLIYLILIMVISISVIIFEEYFKSAPEAPFMPGTITFLIKKDREFVVLLNGGEIEINLVEVVEKKSVYNSFTVTNLQRYDKLKVVALDSEILFFCVDFSKVTGSSRVYL